MAASWDSVSQYADVQSVREVENSPGPGRDVALIVRETGFLYGFVFSSTQTPNGSSILGTNGQGPPGRWIKFAEVTKTPFDSMLEFRTLELMAASPGPSAYSVAYVVDANGDYEFIANDTTPVDGWESIAPSGGASGRWLRIPRQNQSVIMCVDSRGSGGLQSNAFRGNYWDAVSQQTQVFFKGLQATSILVTDATSVPQASRLSDWHYAGGGGLTVAQIDTDTSASEVVEGPATLAILWGGENNVGNGVTAGHTATQIAADTLAEMDTFLENRKAAGVRLCIVGTLPFDGPPLASAAARNAAIVLINGAMLAGYFGARARVVDLASILTLASENDPVVGSQSPLIDSTGNHYLAQAENAIGQTLADVTVEMLGRFGRVLPKPIQQRIPVARASLANEAVDKIEIVDDGTKGICFNGDEDWSFGLFCYITAAANPPQNYLRHIMTVGPKALGFAPAAGAVHLFYGPAFAGDDPASSLQIYVDGVGRFVQNDSIRANKSHIIVCTGSSIKREVAIHCLRQGASQQWTTTCVSVATGVPAWALNPVGFLQVGNVAGGASFNGMVGDVGDIWTLPGRVVSIEEIEDAYAKQRIPAGAKYYPAHEGAGVIIAPAPAQTNLPNGALTGGWSAAGTLAEPWNRAIDQTLASS